MDERRMAALGMSRILRTWRRRRRLRKNVTGFLHPCTLLHLIDKFYFGMTEAETTRVRQDEENIFFCCLFN